MSMLALLTLCTRLLALELLGLVETNPSGGRGHTLLLRHVVRRVVPLHQLLIKSAHAFGLA